MRHFKIETEKSCTEHCKFFRQRPETFAFVTCDCSTWSSAIAVSAGAAAGSAVNPGSECIEPATNGAALCGFCGAHIPVYPQKYYDLDCTMSTAPRLSCLIVLSSSKEGNSAPSFIQTFTLLHSTFTVQIATPGGRPLEFVNQDEQSRRWLNDFRAKVFAIPIGLQTVDPNRYSCLILPHSPGAAHDLFENKDLAHILRHFIQEKKPICAIGMGVAGLFSAVDDADVWSFRRCTLTAVSVFELARSPDFANLPVIPEDVIKDRGALYSSSDPDEVHVVVDRHLVTGQNEQSTLTAVQNLVLLCNQKQAATRKDRHQ